MRNNDIENLLAHVEKSLVNIKNSYDQSLHDKDIPAFLCIDIKNVMENLKSALDYMAQDVAITISNRKANNAALRKKIYFPYGKNKQDYDSSIKKNLPDLEIVRPDIYSLIEGIQPHTCGNAWLYDFCQILNENKHNSLSPQTRTSQKAYSVGLEGKFPAISAPAGEIIAPAGAISIDGIPVEFDLNTGIPHQTSGLEVMVTTWVRFVFQDTNIEVYPLLQIALNKIREASRKLYEKIKEAGPTR